MRWWENSQFLQCQHWFSRKTDGRNSKLMMGHYLQAVLLIGQAAREICFNQLEVLLYYYTHFSLGKSVQAGKGAMRLTLCEAPTRETRPDHYTGNSVPYSLRQVRGFFNVPCWLYNTEYAGDGAYDLSPLSEKTRTSNHLQMSLQRQHVLLSYFKTLSDGPV